MQVRDLIKRLREFVEEDPENMFKDVVVNDTRSGVMELLDNAFGNDFEESDKNYYYEDFEVGDSYFCISL